MGGYARYVWSAYGIVLAVLVVNVLEPLLARRRLERELARRAQNERRMAAERRTA